MNPSDMRACNSPAKYISVQPMDEVKVEPKQDPKENSKQPHKDEVSILRINVTFAGSRLSYDFGLNAD